MPAARSHVCFPPWTERYWELFRLAGDDWAPPPHIKSARSAKGDRLVLEAKFRKPDGQAVRLRTVLRKRGGEWEWGGEQLVVSFRFTPELVK